MTKYSVPQYMEHFYKLKNGNCTTQRIVGQEVIILQVNIQLNIEGAEEYLAVSCGQSSSLKDSRYTGRGI